MLRHAACSTSKHFGLVARRHFHATKYDVAVVGGGIIGLATAQQLLMVNPNLRCILLEKEDRLAVHQTGHNSGVIHAGIYYKPGSLKARLCVEGLKLTYEYCDKHRVPYKKIGKLIVATRNEQLPQLRGLYENGVVNNVPNLKMVSSDEIKEIEPSCKGVGAIHSPWTGIVDWSLVARKYGDVFKELGGTIVTGCTVTGLRYLNGNGGRHDADQVEIICKEAGTPTISTNYVITCGGLYSDKLSALSGCSLDPKIIPFRGDYLVLKSHRSNLVRGNIYPLPDPRFPFLGVHFTPRMDGSVWLGPNAILAFKREGYNKTDFSPREAADALASRGLRNLLYRHWRFVLRELYDGISTRKTVAKLQDFVPELRVEDVESGPAGVRAQALEEDGSLVDDFVFDHGEGDLGKRCLHVRNAPSPAATSSLAIAKVVTGKLFEMQTCQPALDEKT